MTAMRGYVPASDQPGLGVHSLDHFVLAVLDLATAQRFYSDFGLDVRASGNALALNGSDHHILAFAQSPGPGMHHCSWDMSGIDDIGLGAMHMTGRGHTKGWGLGRHVPGSNYFHYIQDPWGSYAEYSCDIDYIPATQNWEAGHHQPEDSFYLWGPEPPPDFTLNREVEAGG